MILYSLHYTLQEIPAYTHAIAHGSGDIRDRHLTNVLEEETLITWITGIVITFFVMAFLFFVFTIIIRSIKNYRLKKTKALEARYFNFLSELISDEEDGMFSMLSVSGEATLSLNKKDISNKLNRAVFRENLLELHRHIGGTERTRLRKVYLMLGFSKEAMKNLEKGRIYKRLQAIRELAAMEIKESYLPIFKLMNSSSEVLRDAALKARARIDPAPLKILDELQYPLTLWQQSFLFNALNNQYGREIPSLAKYLNPSREDIFSFVVKLVSHFHQDECVPELLKHLKNPEWQIRILVIEALGNFPSMEVKEALRTALDESEQTVEKVQILKVMESMVVEEDQIWLFNILQDGERQEVIQACSLLGSMVSEQTMMEKVAPEKIPWVRHAINTSIHSA